MIKQTDFATIDLDTLRTINGGNDLWDATRGAFNMVKNPFAAVVRGTTETVNSLRQGHSVGDSILSGFVQAPGTMNAPKLSEIKKR
jgi:hypothetical protein